MKYLKVFVFTVVAVLISLSACSQNTMTVEYLSAKESVEKAGLGLKNDDFYGGEKILEVQVPIFKGTLTRTVEYKVVSAEFESQKKLFNYLDSIGFRPAILPELTSFYRSHKEKFFSGDFYLCLGTFSQNPEGETVYPFIWGNYIGLTTLGWQKTDLMVAKKVKLLLIKKE